MENIKSILREVWSLGEQNADNSHGGFEWWWNREQHTIIHRIKQAGINPLLCKPEGSDGAEGAAVGNSAAGKGVSVGCEHDYYVDYEGLVKCAKCGKYDL